MRQVWSEDDDERYEIDPESGSIWITDKHSGEVTVQQGDPGMMGTSEMPAIPTYPEQSLKSVGVDDMLARQGAYRQANQMRPDAVLSDQDIANLTGNAFAATQFGADGRPAAQTRMTPNPAAQAAPLSSQTFPLSQAAASPHPGFAPPPGTRPYRAFDGEMVRERVPEPGPPGPMPEPAPTPAPPGTPGVGAGAVRTVQMPDGRFVQVTGPGGGEVTVGGERVTPPGNVPVAESPGPGEPFAPISPELVAPTPPLAPKAIDPTVGVKPPTKNFQAETAPPAPKGPSREDIIRAALDEFRAEPEREIDMDRWWNSRTGTQKAAALGSAAADGFVRGFRGVNIGAVDSLNAAREGDLQAQQADIDRGRAQRADVSRSLTDELALIERGNLAAAKAAGAGAKTLPAGEAAKLGAYAGAYEGLDRVFKEWDSLGVTRYLQNVPLLSSIPSGGKRYQQSTLPPEVASLVQGISGQDATDRQYERFLAMFPQAGDTSATGEAKKKALKLYISGRYAAARSKFEQAGYSVENMPVALGTRDVVSYRPGDFENFVSENPEIAEEALGMQDDLGHVSDPAAGFFEEQ